MLLEPGHVLIIVAQLVDVESVDVLDVLHQVPGVGEVLAAGVALEDRRDVLQLLLLALAGEPQLAVVSLVGEQRVDGVETQPEILQMSSSNLQPLAQLPAVTTDEDIWCRV